MSAPIPVQIRFNGLLVRPRSVSMNPKIVPISDSETGRVIGQFDTGSVEVRLLFDAAGWQDAGKAIQKTLEKKPRRKR